MIPWKLHGRAEVPGNGPDLVLYSRGDEYSIRVASTELMNSRVYSREDARRLIQQYVDHYNTVRLHSAIGFITPADMLAGRQAEIHAARDRKLDEARQLRQKRRQQAA